MKSVLHKLSMAQSKLTRNTTEVKFQSVFFVFLSYQLHSMKHLTFIKQKQPPGGVPRKRCSENMQQIYRRTPMSKCDFKKVALQLY